MDRAGHRVFVRRVCAGHERRDLAGGGGVMFTPEELAEMAAADAEIEKEFRLTQEDLDRSRELDREAKFRALPMEKQKVAEYQKAYRAKKRAAAGAGTPTTAKEN